MKLVEAIGAIKAHFIVAIGVAKYADKKLKPVMPAPRKRKRG